jgi:hypothetical protein
LDHLRLATVHRELGDLAGATASLRAAAPLAGDALAPSIAAEIAAIGRLAEALYRREPRRARASSPAPVRSVAIVLKTFARDAERLPYLFRSIDRFCRGYAELVVVTDPGFTPVALPGRLPVRVLERPVPEPRGPLPAPVGYLWQQAVKMTWTALSDADAAVIVDSDAFFTRPHDPSAFFDGPNPLAVRERWDALTHDGAIWKLAADLCVGHETDHAHMLSPTPVLTRQATEGFAAHVRAEFGLDPRDLFLTNLSNIRLSEFEMFGAFLSHVDDCGYRFLPAGSFAAPSAKIQSVVPLTPAHRLRLERLLA